MTNRPSTPPPPPRNTNSPLPNPITPEQVRRREEARLKAKAAQSHPVAAISTSHASLAGTKRPHSLLSTTHPPSSSRDASSAQSGLSNPASDTAIRPAKKFEKYIEYDFSKMTDTKGGFLSADDDPHNRALQPAGGGDGEGEKRPAHMTQEEWERHKLLKKLRDARAGPFEPGISLLEEADRATGCRECGSLQVDWKWVEVFKCAVCTSCKEALPDRYSLLTKTEAREDYLLTDPELRDEELFPRLERPNPHHSTWNNMQLFLRYQVEEYAFSDKKWGSAEALDVEFEKRQAEKKKQKEKKFKNKLEELKKRTRVEAYKRSRKGGGDAGMAEFGVKVTRRNDRHVHEWGRPVLDQTTGVEQKRCVSCGMECEEYEL